MARKLKLMMAVLCLSALIASPVTGWGRGFGGGMRGGGGGFRGGGFRGGGGGFHGGVGRSFGGLGGGQLGARSIGGMGGTGLGNRGIGGFSGTGLGNRGVGGFSGTGLGNRGIGGFSGTGLGHRGVGGLGGAGLGNRGFGGVSPSGLGSRGLGNLGGSTLSRRPSFSAPNRFGGSGFNADAARRNLSGFGGRQQGPSATAGNRFSSPSRPQLNRFLGLPSDGGLHHLGTGGVGLANRGTVGNGRLDGIGSRLDGGGFGSRTNGIGSRTDGGNGRAGNLPERGDGPLNGRGDRPGVRPNRPGERRNGWSRISPSRRYNTAVAVRRNYNHWGLYGRDWFRRYPGAWYAAGWATGAAWNACTWADAAAYLSYASAPLYYDYGNNVVYQDNSVYVNGNNVGTSQQYYDQAVQLATTNAGDDTAKDGDWLPLGVFALVKSDADKSDVSLQLAVNKQGIIRGNYTDVATGKNQLIKGSVDKTTQRVAFSVGDDAKDIVETGLYDLTKDEAPCLIHYGKDRTEQWLLVRMEQPKSSN